MNGTSSRSWGSEIYSSDMDHKSTGRPVSGGVEESGIPHKKWDFQASYSTFEALGGDLHGYQVNNKVPALDDLNQRRHHKQKQARACLTVSLAQ